MAHECDLSCLRPWPEGCCMCRYAHGPHWGFLSQLKTTRWEKRSFFFGKKRTRQAVSYLFHQIIIKNNNSSGKQLLLPGVCHLSWNPSQDFFFAITSRVLDYHSCLWSDCLEKKQCLCCLWLVPAASVASPCVLCVSPSRGVCSVAGSGAVVLCEDECSFFSGDSCGSWGAAVSFKITWQGWCWG